MNIKTLRPAMLLGFLAFLITSLPLLAQEEATSEEPTWTYAVVNYMKSTPGQNAIAMEKEVWEPIHQQLMKAGKRSGWDVFEVVFPSGASAEYDYITVDYFVGMEHMNIGGDPLTKAFQAAHPGKKWETVAEKTEAARQMVRSEMYVWMGGTDGEWKAAPKYFNIHKMQVAPNMHDEYRKMEMQLAKPMHQAAKEKGNMLGWNFWLKIFPNGSSTGHNYVTGEAYASMEDMERMASVNLFEEVYPERDMQETIDYMVGLREEVSSELWALEASIRPTAAEADNKE